MSTSLKLATRPLVLPLLVAAAGCSYSARPPEPAVQTQTRTEAAPIDDSAVSSAPLAANAVVTIDATALRIGQIPTGVYEPPAAPLNTRQVTFASEGADFDPCLTPDGAKLVFASTQHRPTPDIYIKNVDGRVVTQLTDDAASDATPSVSPDGTRIAVASDRSGN